MIDMEWDDISDAVPIDVAERDKWVEDDVTLVLNDPINGTYTTSGDSIVVVFQHPDGDLYVVDAVIRRSGSVPAGRGPSDG